MKSIYEVTVTETRQVRYYVLADTRAEADDDAREITHEERDFEEIDHDTDVREVSPEQVRSGWLWTGGPNGEVIHDAAAYVRKAVNLA